MNPIFWMQENLPFPTRAMTNRNNRLESGMDEGSADLPFNQAATISIPDFFYRYVQPDEESSSFMNHYQPDNGMKV